MKIKFAIFKNKYSGLVAFDYIDSVKELNNYPYINSSDLPCIINSNGGYTQFNVKDKYSGFSDLEFVEFRKGNDINYAVAFEDAYPLQVPFRYGWISPTGETISCLYEEHSKCAKDICLKKLNLKTYNAEQTLEELGWAKVTKGSYGIPYAILKPKYYLSRGQVNAVIKAGLTEIVPEIKDMVDFSLKKIKQEDNNVNS